MKEITHLPPNKHYIPEGFKKVASGIEKQFAELLIKEFQKSIPKANETTSAQDIYESWNVSEQAQAMATHPQGLGLKDLILDEIYPRSHRTKEAFQHYQRIQEDGVTKGAKR